MTSSERKIILACPTRGQRERVWRFSESIVRTTHDLSRVIAAFGVDPDDMESVNTIRAVQGTYPDLQVEISVSGVRGCGQHWRNISSCVLETDDSLVMLCGDDLVFQTPGWDVKMLDASTEHGWLYYGRDGQQNEGLSTHPWVTVRTARLMSGFTMGGTEIVNDNVLWNIAHLYTPKRWTYLDDIFIEHAWTDSHQNLHRRRAASIKYLNSEAGARRFTRMVEGFAEAAGKPPVLQSYTSCGCFTTSKRQDGESWEVRFVDPHPHFTASIEQEDWTHDEW